MPKQLDQEIKKLVESGQNDPIDIARKIISEYSPEWVEAELYARAEEILSELARRLIASKSQELATTEVPVPVAQHRALHMWIPGFGWKLRTLCTSTDLRARASWYQSLADAAILGRNWCLEVAALMDVEGARTLGDLRAELPAPPKHELTA